jgi:menaquinol-cytochrome c reductase iron-sulfur subunit
MPIHTNPPPGSDPVAESLPVRRPFFRRLTYFLGAVAAALAGIPFVGYLFSVRGSQTLWVPLGPVEKFPRGETRLVTFDNPLGTAWDGMTGNTGVYVRYEGKDGDKKDQFRVFASNCAHLGCPVTFFPESGLFMCPCHGGVYYADGERASGPPPRGLYHCVWRVQDGQLEVQAPHYPTLHDTEKRS